MKVTAFVVDDEPVARAGLRAMLRAFDWVDVVGEAADGESAVPAAVITISVAATRGAAPCRTAFSTSVCSANAGTRSSSRSSGMSARTISRSPKRMRSTAR